MTLTKVRNPVVLTKLGDHPVERVVLLIVVFQRQNLNDRRKHLANRDLIAVLQNHPAKAASGVVRKTRRLLLEAWLELAQDGRVLLDDLRVGFAELDQSTNRVGSVGLGLRIHIRQATQEELQQLAGKRGDGILHAGNDLSDDADGRGPLEVLAAIRESQDALLEDLPELSEASSEGSSETRNNIQCPVNDDPVEFRGLFHHFLGFLILIKVLLAQMLLLNQGDDLLDNLLKDLSVGDQRGTSVSKVLRHVRADIRNHSPE